jgi:hypothetical protein
MHDVSFELKGANHAGRETCVLSRAPIFPGVREQQTQPGLIILESTALPLAIDETFYRQRCEADIKVYLLWTAKVVCMCSR